jgi:predicted branched-subunit amino acid permease
VSVAAPRWLTLLLLGTAVALVPWTLWLTFSLPSRHVTQHYDVAWVGFDVALAAAFASTALAAVSRSRWLAPLAAATAAMLLCDAWFDVVTSQGGGERVEALLEAALAELPLTALCLFVVYDAERVRESVRRLRRG